MKVAVIGCTHAGTAAITNILNMYPEAEIDVFEKNDNVSFLSCGIALYVGGVVKDPDGLFYASVEGFEKQGVRMHMQHIVTECDTNNKTLVAKNLKTDETREYQYDKLIITSGSWPVTPPIPGSDLENVQLCKNFHHANEIIQRSEHAENIVVVGAGYIGIELVEAFEQAGKQVTLIDSESRILNRYLDEEFTSPIEKTLSEKGVTLALDQTVSSFQGDGGKVTQVITGQSSYDADLVIMCIGFRPNTALFTGQVDMLENGAIIVNEYMQTSKKDVFAAGDCCAVAYNPTEKPAYIPLATNAVRMGTLAAYNLLVPRIPHQGTQGTSGLKIHQHNLSATGLTETAAAAAGMRVGSALLEDTYRPEFMPENAMLRLKVVYEMDSHRIVGAQVISEGDFTQAMNTLSVAIQNKMTIEQMALTDFFFQPHYNKPWNYLNQVCIQAMKQIEEKQIRQQKEPGTKAS